MRRSRLTSFLLITAMNFALGIFVLASITTLLEKRTPHHKEAVDSSSASLILNDNQRLAKRSLLSGHVDRNKLLVQRDKFLTSSDFYFRVELKISRAECSSIEFFNNSATLHSIEQMLNGKFNEILDSKTNLAVDALRIHPQLTKTRNHRIESRENDVACDYVLAVDVVFYFSFSCEFSCRENEVRRLISTLKTMKNRLDSSWTFSLIASRDFPADVRYQPKEIRFFRISKFHENSIFIKSLIDDRFFSTFIADAGGTLTSLITSKRDKSLIRVQAALDPTKHDEDPMSIFVSFSTNDAPDVYLRHQLGRIKLSKYEDSTLFRQDATFKIIETASRSNIFIFESTNIPRNYISLDKEGKSTLILTFVENVVTEKIDRTYFFRFSQR